MLTIEIVAFIAGFILVLFDFWYRYQPRKEYHIVTLQPLPEEEARLSLIIGPMFAGKTSELIRRLQKLYRAGRRCLIIKHTMDQRFNEKEHELKLSTHDGAEFTILTNHPQLQLVYNQDLEQLKSTISDYDVIIIEEAHMWQEQWWSFTMHCLYQAKKKVIISTIDSYSPKNQTLQPIANLADAVIHSTDICKLTTICEHCRRDNATQSFFKGTTKNLIEIGGQDKYEPVCWDCILEHNRA